MDSCGRIANASNQIENDHMKSIGLRDLWIRMAMKSAPAYRK
jgi:hypothetical protein